MTMLQTINQFKSKLHQMKARDPGNKIIGHTNKDNKMKKKKTDE